MSITLWRHKGAPLTIEELDQNFEELQKRLEALESQALPSEGLGQVRLEGDELCFESTLGRLLGRVRLPAQMFVHTPPSSSSSESTPL